MGQARVVEKIVALVGSDIILQSEVEDRAAPMMAESPPSPIPASGGRATQRHAPRDSRALVDDQLWAQQATELKLTVSSDEIDRAIEQIKQDYGLTDAQLQDELRKQGLTMAAYRQNTKTRDSQVPRASTSPWAPRSTWATARCRATTTAT